MIEKIMKAVKSGNKKRGRNITVGAVVGMLLSCTVVMGADVVGVEIKESDGNITFTPSIDKDIYPENTWDVGSTTYTNNTTISLENNGDEGVYGLKLSGDLSNLSFVNNGSISAIGIGAYSEYGYGIYNEDGSIKNITNIGKISGNYYAIYNYNSRSGSTSSITSLINSGSISSDYYGIGNYSRSDGTSSITSLINTGSISAGMRGIYNDDLSSIGEIINSGTISAGTGIDNEDSGSIGNLKNKGIIYGQSTAISNYTSSETISNANNYGLLVSGNTYQNVVKNVTIVDSSASATTNEIKNYGLAFTADSSANKYIGGGKTDLSGSNFDIDYHNNFGKIHQNISIDGVDYDIINVGAEVDTTSKEIKNWKSLTLEEGKLTYYDSNGASDKEESISPDKKYILNGIEDTLKISGRKNELNNSVVNAYKTAVVMDQEMSMLTLDNTVVNGGVADGSTTISITENGSTLTLKGDSVINTGDEGVAITVDGNDNAVTLEGNAIVNGKMESNGNNILNLYGKTDGSMNMFHDISGFTDISIDNNVTFFEDMKVTGTDKVTVEKSGVLSLRLKKNGVLSPAAIASSTSISTATHAFSDTDGMIIKGNSPEETGTLNFITNGIGKKVLVNMKNIELNNIKVKTNSIIDKVDLDTCKDEGYIYLGAGSDLDGIVNPKVNKYNSLNKIYKSIYNSTDEKNLDGLRDILGMTFLGKNYDYNSSSDQLKILLSYLNDIYTGTPYSYSSELSRRSVGMFRDIVTENEFRPNQDKWLIMGGLTHADGGTKDTYYGQNYHGVDIGTADTEADMKLTGAYMLAKYGYSENLSLGVTLGGNKSEAKLDMAKVKGNSGYLGVFAENYRGNLTLKAGAGVQYSEYDADRRTLGNAYSDKYSDMTYDIYLNGRYSHQVGDNLFLEPYATLSYTYVDQDGANEGSKVLAIETDSKSFDYTVGKVGVDLKKVIPHEKGKSTLSAGVSYTKILDGADEEYITGRFKGSTTDFDILVAHKNEHSIGLNAKYALELESGVIFDVKGSYSVERDSHNGSAKNKTKGEWIVGAGVGYKF
ncbi:autotransporter family protein [Fusobacterium ulcerans]|uniref:autotransporter family protein n=1 Tax=Fusobacterium ulcerans TaxID=861 RepID=UPI001D0ACE38|nr:autotransporter outer membrane beta-barrel domain-containing protein [Fusobacterium ulcerans]MCB8565765.1 autotransporter outer membrane beta-barrel domain-containing protein [Fusobacterium ulcerans]MCB8650663.1 autotransporter outer membrane beta-barrel domain-containing protein [Fusobacterium ulcerans]